MIPVTYRCPWTVDRKEDRRVLLKAIAESGMRRLVLSYAMMEQLILQPELLPVWREELREFGLCFMDSHAPWGKGKELGTSEEDLHKQAVARHKMFIRFCHELDITSMTVHPGGGPDPEAAFAALLRSLEELLPEAERAGVTLCLENVWTPMDHSARLLAAVRRFDTSYLGLCYDTGHANLSEKGRHFPEESVVPRSWTSLGLPVVWEENLAEKFHPWMVNCHFHDNHGISDEHNLPGDGTVDWPHIFSVLNRAPRLRCVQCEVRIPSTGVVPSVWREAFRKLSPELDA